MKEPKKYIKPDFPVSKEEFEEITALYKRGYVILWPEKLVRIEIMLDTPNDIDKKQTPRKTKLAATGKLARSKSSKSNRPGHRNKGSKSA